jgi:peptidoglycan/xylan/chitin deacetylase (PgdA/CDA1 family)
MSKKRIRRRKSFFVSTANVIFFLAAMLVIGSIIYVLITILSGRDDSSIIRLVKRQYYSSLPSKPRTTVIVPILLYHYVEYVRDSGDTIRKSLDILPNIFVSQVETLQNAGFTFITPSYVSEVINGKKILPKKPIILSFDDGYGDFYTDVLPILERYHVTAVQYVISGFIDHPNYMTSDQLREVIGSGLVEIGCHTMHHPNLKYENVISARQEINGCKHDLKSQFGIDTVSFAYPYGGYNDTTPTLVENAGFTNAVTTNPGVVIAKNNIFLIPRIRPGSRVRDELTGFIERSIRERPDTSTNKGE